MTKCYALKSCYGHSLYRLIHPGTNPAALPVDHFPGSNDCEIWVWKIEDATTFETPEGAIKWREQKNINALVVEIVPALGEVIC